MTTAVHSELNCVRQRNLSSHPRCDDGMRLYALWWYGGVVKVRPTERRVFKIVPESPFLPRKHSPKTYFGVLRAG